MTPTFIGALVAMAGFLLLCTASRLAMLQFVLACALLNGAAVATIPALGSVSIPPALLAAGFLLLRCILPARRSEPLFGTSFADNGWLLLLVGYSAAGAFTLPFLFAGEIAVVPLRPSNNPLGLTPYPLRFSPQNITTACYMLLTLVGAVCAHAAVRRVDAAARLARSGSVIALTHAALGWFAALARDTPADAVFQALRNGHYMQLDQAFEGFARLTGISPEPSLYASFALVWFVFTAELWLRSVDRRWSGPAALALGLTLLASTSSTAYVGLAAWSAVMLVRQVFLVGTIPARKGLVVAACAATLGVSALALAAGSDEAARALARVLRLTTTDKLDSGSGVARFLWARQGVEAFVQSWGLGIGAGSFRSSSILTAILGSSGLIGIAALALFLRQVFRPFSIHTWRRAGVPETDVSAAAAWAVVLVLASLGFRALTRSGAGLGHAGRQRARPQAAGRRALSALRPENRIRSGASRACSITGRTVSSGDEGMGRHPAVRPGVISRCA